MGDEFEDWVLVVPGSLLRDLAKQPDGDGDETPTNANEAREKRILNRRLDRFLSEE